MAVPDAATLIAAQRDLIGSTQWPYVEGMVQARAEGSGFLLDVAAFYDAATPPDDAKALGELGFDPADATTTDLTYSEFLHRMAAGEATFRASGDWFHPHPGLNLLLPDEVAAEFVAEVAAELTPDHIGPSGVVLLYPVKTTDAPLPRMPRGRRRSSSPCSGPRRRTRSPRKRSSPPTKSCTTAPGRSAPCSTPSAPSRCARPTGSSTSDRPGHWWSRRSSATTRATSSAAARVSSPAKKRSDHNGASLTRSDRNPGAACSRAVV